MFDIGKATFRMVNVVDWPHLFIKAELPLSMDRSGPNGKGIA